MYLPKSQYKKVVNDGRSYKSEDGQLVNSNIIETSSGNYFAISSSDLDKGDFSKATQVTPVNGSTSPNENVRNTYFPNPSDEDYNRGVISRYYVKDLRTSKVREVRKEAYDLDKNETFLRFGIINWIIEGPKEDMYLNGYLVEGAVTKNRKTVESADKTLTGLKDYIKDYGQFVK